MPCQILFLNSVALLSTAIRSVSATINGKNHFSGTCRLFEPHRLAVWGHKFIITLAFMSCHNPSKSLQLNHTNFQSLPSSSPHYLCLSRQLLDPEHCKHEQRPVYQPLWPTGRAAPVAFLSLCRGQLGFCWWKPHLHKCMHSGGLAWTKLLE